MPNEERRLKLMKLDKYRKNLTKEDWKIVTHTHILTVLVINIIFKLGGYPKIVDVYFEEGYRNLLFYLSTIVSPGVLVSLINSICKRCNIESKIEDLELNLDFDKQSGGKRL